MNKQQENLDRYKPKYRRVNLQLGALVRCEDMFYRISQLLDFESLVGIEVETGRATVLSIGALLPPSDAPSGSPVDIESISDKEWKTAQLRFEVIRPLLAGGKSRAEVESCARANNVDTATLYRWLKRYQASGDFSALIPKPRGWRVGSVRISSFAEKLIQKCIEEYYLTRQRPTAQKVVTEVARICHERGVPVPSPSTVRLRLNRISEKQRLRGHGQTERARNKFLPAAGAFPNADFPLSVVQIDHTPVDVILVDDLYRKPIGRPWLTVAIDVNSRVITGYYVSFDNPSETSVGLCVAHSVLQKEEWLLLHKVDVKWPVWGLPKTIHVDNGADFRSDDFKKSCMMYGIHVEFRPVRQPRYGGHIERLIGTLMKEVHDLPGTTFSSVKEKDGYDSEKYATLTKSEFEEWLVTYICKVYHHKVHRGIGTSPLKKWEIGVFGNGTTVGIGIPNTVPERMKLHLDFLPSYRRTIQTFGVTIDGRTYYSDALRTWINSSDPDSPKEKRKFIFRRDPRDISSVWLWDPDLKEYFRIPFSDQSLPSISAWEHEAAKKVIKEQGNQPDDDRMVLRAITEMRAKVDESQQRTKKTRRQAQRRREHEKKVSVATPLPQVPGPPLKGGSFSDFDGMTSGDIDVYGDIA